MDSTQRRSDRSSGLVHPLGIPSHGSADRRRDDIACEAERSAGAFLHLPRRMDVDVPGSDRANKLVDGARQAMPESLRLHRGTSSSAERHLQVSLPSIDQAVPNKQNRCVSTASLAHSREVDTAIGRSRSNPRLLPVRAKQLRWHQGSARQVPWEWSAPFPRMRKGCPRPHRTRRCGRKPDRPDRSAAPAPCVRRQNACSPGGCAIGRPPTPHRNPFDHADRP